MKPLLLIEPNHIISELTISLPSSPLRKKDLDMSKMDKHFLLMSWLNFQYKEIIKE